jgi:hypothetical protein
MLGQKSQSQPWSHHGLEGNPLLCNVRQIKKSEIVRSLIETDAIFLIVHCTPKNIVRQ